MLYRTHFNKKQTIRARAQAHRQSARAGRPGSQAGETRRPDLYLECGFQTLDKKMAESCGEAFAQPKMGSPSKMICQPLRRLVARLRLNHFLAAAGSS